MTLKERDGKYIIIHGGKAIRQKFDTEDEAWSWADSNIDDQVFDKPNSFSPPLEYEDSNEAT